MWVFLQPTVDFLLENAASLAANGHDPLVGIFHNGVTWTSVGHPPQAEKSLSKCALLPQLHISLALCTLSVLSEQLFLTTRKWRLTALAEALWASCLDVSEGKPLLLIELFEIFGPESW